MLGKKSAMSARTTYLCLRQSSRARVKGVYAWYFDSVPAAVPTKDCVRLGVWTLLYVGMSPRTFAAGLSRQNLRTRLRYHFRGNAEGSTLRLTVGCLLSATLGLQLRRVGSGKRLTFGEGEKRLTAWLSDHARVCWVVSEEPEKLETQLIGAVSLPLNLDQNTAHEFCRTLEALRRSAREAARALPVLGANAALPT